MLSMIRFKNFVFQFSLWKCKPCSVGRFIKLCLRMGNRMGNVLFCQCQCEQGCGIPSIPWNFISGINDKPPYVVFVPPQFFPKICSNEKSTIKKYSMQLRRIEWLKLGFLFFWSNEQSMNDQSINFFCDQFNNGSINFGRWSRLSIRFCWSNGMSG